MSSPALLSRGPTSVFCRQGPAYGKMVLYLRCPCRQYQVWAHWKDVTCLVLTPSWTSPVYRSFSPLLNSSASQGAIPVSLALLVEMIKSRCLQLFSPRASVGKKDAPTRCSHRSWAPKVCLLLLWGLLWRESTLLGTRSLEPYNTPRP